MKNVEINLSKESLKAQLRHTGQLVQRYSVVSFIVFVALIYGFLFFRINVLTGQRPTDDQIQSKVSATQTLHINESAIRQLESLRDNSVNVQTLFDQARSNPFQ